MTIPNWVLRQKQSLPLEAKIVLTRRRIRSWYEYWGGDVYVSFSGGKDSTVLLHLVRGLYPSVPAVFLDTGLEYPEIRSFVRTIRNVIWLKPKKPFTQVIQEYGYPVVSKEVSQKVNQIRNTNSQYLRDLRMGLKGRKSSLPKKWHFLIEAPFPISSHCCDVLKKIPSKRYESNTKAKPFIGNLASDSSQRTLAYMRWGCNSYERSRPMSQPLSFWCEEDIWNYIESNNLPYSTIYDKGYTRTGCMFCTFGIMREDSPNRFQKMKETHPKLWNYCINTLGVGEILSFINIPSGEEVQ